MPKPLLEDMVRVKHPKREIKEKIEKIEAKKDSSKENQLEKMWREPRRVEQFEVEKKSKNHYGLWFIALISMTFCFFAISYLFSKAEINVDPKIQEVALNQNLSASKDVNNDSLSFNLMVVSDEESKSVKGGEDKTITEKAKGVVIVFNSYSASSQILAINTKLEGSNNKIYKTDKKVVVPGVSKGVPGSIEVSISGGEAGVAYNSSPIDFNILGFKGTAKYAKFKVRSKGPITGGIIMKTKVVSEADKAAALKDLQVSLKAKLFNKAVNQINDFILFKDAIFYNMDDTNAAMATPGADGMVPITLKGTLYGFLFNEKILTKKIAEKNIEKYDGSDVFIPKIRDLKFSLVNEDNTLFENMKDISFNLSGPIKIVWRLDESKFLTELLGKSKKDFNQILSRYSNIDSAILKINPVWKMSIPDKLKDIKITVNYPR